MICLVQEAARHESASFDFKRLAAQVLCAKHDAIGAA